jgi:hypothetical protein
MLSGWLFADLLLAVSIIFLSTARGAGTKGEVAATATATPAPTATDAPTATSTPMVVATVQACRPVPSKQKVELDDVGGGHGQDPSDDELLAAFASHRGDRAFVVLTFPHYRLGQDGAAHAKAEEINDRLRALMPATFTEDTAFERMRYEDGTEGGQRKVDFWIWFREDNCS